MSTYTVKSGDTLIEIAIKNNVAYSKLLALNPACQENPDRIKIGQIITLPEEPPEPKETGDTIPLVQPVPMGKGSVSARPCCQKIEVAEVCLFTGDHPENYYALDKTFQQDLFQEAKYVQKFLEQYQSLLQSAPDDNATPEQIESFILKKQAWYKRGVDAGIFAPLNTADDHKSRSAEQENLDVLNSQLKEIKTRIHFFLEYDKDDELSTQVVKEKVLAELGAQKDKIQEQIKQLEKSGKSSPSKTWKSSSQAVKPNDLHGGFNGKKKSRTHQINSLSQLKEVFIATTNHLAYVRYDFVEQRRKYWSQNSHKENLRKVLNLAGKEALKDIPKAIKEDFKQNKFNIKALNWTMWDTASLPAGAWSASTNKSHPNGENRFAVSADAQLLRFAAQATTTATCNPQSGKVELGVATGATFSLAEGKVDFSMYRFSRRGTALNFQYIDADGHTAYYSFGTFRGLLKLELSCFVGAQLQGEAKASANLTRERPSGAESLVAPNVSVGPHDQGQQRGELGVSANGFAGSQVGGQATGALEWAPPKGNDSHANPATDIAVPKFKTLAQIQEAGNLSLGLGFNLEWRLRLENDTFYFDCGAKLVFGAGAGGNFSVEVDVPQFMHLAWIVAKGLSIIGYRILANIERSAYEFIQKAMALALLCKDIKSVDDALRKGAQAIDRMWDNVSSEWSSVSDSWGKSIEDHKKVKQLVAKVNHFHTYKTFPPHYFLPESLGIVLDKLLITFWYSNEKGQEKAINLLLSYGIPTWRKFEEVLSRINPTGTKNNSKEAMMTNLHRLNAILDHNQQKEFNTWVQKLILNEQENDQSFDIDNYYTYNSAFSASPHGIDYKRNEIRQNIQKWGLASEFGIDKA